MAICKCNGEVSVTACKLLKMHLRQNTNVPNDRFPYQNSLQRQWAGTTCQTGSTLSSCRYTWSNLTPPVNIYKRRNYSHVGDDLPSSFTNTSPLFTCLSLSSLFFWAAAKKKSREVGVCLFMYLFSVASTSAPAAKQLLGGLLLPLGFTDLPDE